MKTFPPTRALFPSGLLAIAIGTITLANCAGYVPGQQAYWDAQVKEMCQKDGGVTVYETIELSEEEYKRLGGIYGGLPIPDERTDRSNYPYVRERIESRIREANPEVVRTEELVKRRSDGKLLARSVSYSRRGGDFPTGLAHDSLFSCPQQAQLSKQIFKLKEEAK